jgi:hypothetical protein
MAVQKTHRAGGVIVMRGIGDKHIQLAVEAHETDIVIGLPCPIHALRDTLEPLALPRRGALRAQPGQQPFEFPPHFEHQQLLARISL